MKKDWLVLLITLGLTLSLSLTTWGFAQNELVSFAETDGGNFYAHFSITSEKGRELEIMRQYWDMDKEGEHIYPKNRPCSLNNYIDSVFVKNGKVSDPIKATENARKREFPFRLELEGTKSIIVKGSLPIKLQDKFLWGGILMAPPKEKKATINSRTGILHKLYFSPKKQEIEEPDIGLKRQKNRLIITIKNNSEKRIHVKEGKAFFQATKNNGRTIERPLERSLLVLPHHELKLKYENKKIVNAPYKFFAFPFESNYYGAKITQ